MNTVKIHRVDLLKKIIANRSKHREAFLEAQEGFRAAVIKELDTMLKEAQQGKNFRRSINLPEPSDHTNDYNKIISMLEMSVDKVIEIKDSEFDMYVMDNWNWKHQFSTTNSMYFNKNE